MLGCAFFISGFALEPHEPPPHTHHAVVSSQTINSALKIDVHTNRRRAADPSAHRPANHMALQSTMEGVDYILVDEMSMIGQG